MTTTFGNAHALTMPPASRAAWLRDPHLWTRVALPLLLLASAILKSHQMIASPFEDGSDAAASVAYWWGQIAVVCAQIVLSFWLLSGLWLRLGWIAAAAIFVIFAGVSLWGVARGDTTCASCFGALRISPWHSLATDLAALGALVLFPPRARIINACQTRRAAGIWIACAAIVALTAALVLAWFQPGVLGVVGAPEPAGCRAVLLRPSQWVGQPCPILSHVVATDPTDGGEAAADALAQGRWLVILRRAGCGDCEAVVPEYSRLVREIGRDTPMRLALIDLAQPHEREFANSGLSVENRAAVLRAYLDRSRRWHAPIPSVMILRDGRVEQALETAVPGTAAIVRETLMVN